MTTAPEQPERLYTFEVADPTEADMRRQDYPLLRASRARGGAMISSTDVLQVTRADLEALRTEITRYLEHGLVFFEVRSHSSAELGDPPTELKARLSSQGGEEWAWERACQLAEGVSGGADIFRVVAGVSEDYIVSYCGGDQHWWLPGTTGAGLHQIGSGGFCWDCFKDEYGDRPEGVTALVRHPVTVEEIGNGHYVTMPGPIRFGNSGCDSCPGGYNVAHSSGSVEYIAHANNCIALYGAIEEQK